MAVTLLDVPAGGAVVFEIEQAWTSEGYVKVTLWRWMMLHDLVVFFGQEPSDAVPGGKSPQDFLADDPATVTRQNIVVKLPDRLLTMLPEHEEEAENYFSEVATHGFEIGIYNSNSLGDIDSVSAVDETGAETTSIDLTKEIEYTTGETFFGSDARLMFKYIRPFESTQLWGKWEFQPTGEDWDEPEIGECQSAIEGQDYRWYHGVKRLNELNEDNPYLDERENKPLDAEQIFTMRFVHVVHSGLDRVPVKPYNSSNPPTPVPTDTWGMPIYDIASGNDDGAPWTPAALSGADGAGPTAVPGIFDIEFISGAVYNLLWLRHIDARYWLQLIMDFAFGSGNWTIKCDDSPIKLNGAVITNGVINFNSPTVGHSPDPAKMDQTTAVLNSEQLYIVNFEHFCGPAPNYRGSILLPQSLWGVIDDLTINNPPWPQAPILENSWPKYLQSQWDVVREVCMMFGWIPLMGKDGSGKVQLYLKDRTTPFEDIFAGPTPVSAKPTAFPESENGIAIVGLKTFLNARETDGWYDDILAFKYDAANYPAIHEFIDDSRGTVNVTSPQKNPYVVPITAQKPATLNTLLRTGGYQYIFSNGLGNPKTPYGMFVYAASVGFAPMIDTGINYPMVTPLIPGKGPLIVGAGSNPDLLTLGPVHTPSMAYDYRPVLQTWFSYVDGNGSELGVYNNSWRQCLARFYGMLFVKSDRKYAVSDGTVNNFWLINQVAPVNDGDPEVGDRAGKPSWRNCRLFNQRMFPDGKRYWLKRKKLSFNSMSTDGDYLRVTSRNPYIGNRGNFQDDGEDTGKVHQDKVENGGGGTSITGSGGGMM
jgi:hypothetical protein